MSFASLRLSLGAVALAALLGLSTPAIFAQSTTQGAISGAVVDKSGAAVAGAALKIRNTATNATVTLVADSNGYFKAPLLEPGSYEMTVTATGFASSLTKSIVVSVGQVTTIEPHLAVASTTTEITVSEAAASINTDSPDFSATVPQVALENIPMNNRRWSSLAMTTPGVVSNGDGFGLVSVRGVSPLLNNVEIDGADDNQAYFAEERGRTREAYSTSGSAVREFAVNSGVYSAEYGRAAGGVITSVTKSGTNALHGEAYFFDKESNWNAFNNYTKITKLDSTTNSFVSQHLKPKDLRKIYGFTAGGALIKDRLFWIYTFDQHAHIFPVTAVAYSPSSFYALPTELSSAESCNPTTGTYASTGTNSTINADTCTLAARQGISYTAATALWEKWVNNLNTDLGQAARAGNQEINTPKLDWQVNEKNHVSVLYHRLRWDSPAGVQTSPTTTYARDTQGNDYVKIDYGVAKWTSLITSNVSNELLFQYGRELGVETQQSYTDYTKSNLTGSTGNVPYVNLGASSFGFNLGSPYYSYRQAYPEERKTQIGDMVYWNLKSHSLKFGFDVIRNADMINNTYYSNGTYTYGYLGNFINDQVNHSRGITSTCNSSGYENTISSKGAAVTGAYPCYSKYQQGYGPSVFDVATTDYGFFVQDNWKATSRLTVEAGLRYDYEQIPGAKSSLTTATGSFVPYTGLTNAPSDKLDFGPRVGFAYNLTGDNRTVIRGGYGLYYGRVNNGNILQVRLNTGSPNGQYVTTYKAKATSSYAAGPQLPEIMSTGSAPKPSSYYFDANLKLPAVQEFDVAAARELGHGNTLQLSYLGGLGRHLPNFLNKNLTGVQNVTISVVDSSNAGPLAKKNISSAVVPTYTAYGNTDLFGEAATSFQSISEFTSNVNSSYNALVAELKNTSLKHIQWDMNYTWSHALDYAQSTATGTQTENWYDPYSNAKANYGNSAFNVPNRFVAWVLYSTPEIHSTNAVVKALANGWSFNDSFQMQNGLPYSAVIDSNNSYNSYSAVGSGWNGAGGSTGFFPALGINTLRYPRRVVDDLRVEKDFALKGGYKLELLANFFNVANHQNVDGIRNTAYSFATSSSSPLTSTLTYNNANAASAYGTVSSSNNSAFLYTPRQIEISARFSF